MDDVLDQLKRYGLDVERKGVKGNKKGKNDIGFDNPIYIYI